MLLLEISPPHPLPIKLQRKKDLVQLLSYRSVCFARLNSTAEVKIGVFNPFPDSRGSQNNVPEVAICSPHVHRRWGEIRSKDWSVSGSPSFVCSKLEHVSWTAFREIKRIYFPRWWGGEPFPAWVLFRLRPLYHPYEFLNTVYHKGKNSKVF